MAVARKLLQTPRPVEFFPQLLYLAPEPVNLLPEPGVFHPGPEQIDIIVPGVLYTADNSAQTRVERCGERDHGPAEVGNTGRILDLP